MQAFAAGCADRLTPIALRRALRDRHLTLPGADGEDIVADEYRTVVGREELPGELVGRASGAWASTWRSVPLLRPDGSMTARGDRLPATTGRDAGA